ncbi:MULTISPECIES: DAK2 domain-containing protein [Streptomycetaceae]|uniref:Dihydroxyacetone kinase n=1 Tax=Streptantibioticus cattleyicolor (strain ATCC 35852 / DSM 46488 / JCM 4925 / NBRC 14057 / NRRL 8057) TaxID=1003195 RepID=F8JSM9_STREN|nr:MULTISPECIES: DAK2 domain-containing protein [Streptomycetaceae]AEW96760.1 dihydroxyacetone kinase [Streptantibioticus cattleyicolor NRRL 8057 = DSM 46488]MYS61246.1 DAK2 domain-containing protein [Streptomyces sp. SID5468]CCB77096.1 putative dihydroxyacetone kinase [Streptantibioticus cattleyicolor NRRL 8057 = DSM 46488]
MPPTLDAVAVRTWCRLALAELGRAREEIDAINVYPVADGDTGTNLYLTVESAAQSVDAVFDGHASSGARPDRAQTVRAMAHGALIGARGNSGTILAQLLRGMSEILAAPQPPRPDDADTLRRALRHAAASAHQAVAHPAEGTMLTVAAAAADAACATAGDVAAAARAAYDAACAALARTPGQLAALGRAGVVDAGGRGLVAVLGALARAVGATAQAPPATTARPLPDPRHDCAAGRDPHLAQDGPAFEVVYLLEAADSAVPALRARLDALGDCLVVVGGDGLWNVHVHVDDAGAAVEAGVDAGRPYRIRITHFGDQCRTGRRTAALEQRAVVAVADGDGLAALYAGAGATVVPVPAGEPLASGDLAAAVRRAHAREVVLLPNDAELLHLAGVAAEQARADGLRVALIPTRSAVQGIAALAVHQPSRRFDEDVVAMTAAAGATRYAAVAVAERESWTMAGVCQAGDLLGLIDGDVVVIGDDLARTAVTVLDRMLAAGGEMVTLVPGAGAPPGLADHLTDHVREHHLAVDTVVHPGGQHTCPLVIGVE